MGRWWAIDPALQMASPYSAMGNRPNMAIDPDGMFWQGIGNLFVELLGNWLIGVADNAINNDMSMKDAMANAPVTFNMSVNSQGQFSTPSLDQYNTMTGINQAVTSMDQQIASLSGFGSSAIDPMAGLGIPLMREYPRMEMRGGRSINRNKLNNNAEVKNDDPFLDIDFNIKMGLGFQEKIKIFGLGEQLSINPLIINYMSFKWNSNSKKLSYIPYESIYSSFDYGGIALFGGIKHNWYQNSTTTYGQFGLLSKEYRQPARITLLEIGSLFGVGYDFKITLSPSKFINAYIKDQIEWNNSIGYSKWGLMH